MMTLSKNNYNPTKIQLKHLIDFGNESFSSFKKKCARIDPLKGVVLINIAAR